MANSELVLAVAGAAALLGFLAGLARPRTPAAPIAATALIIAGYIIIVIAAGAWAAECRGCDGWVGSDSSRVADFQSAIFVGAILAAAIVAVIWAGAGIAAVVRGRSTHPS
jgi:hypothetical protein